MHGFLNVLKPPGMSSHDVVGWVRRITKVRKVGHLGTLDPGAAGVLPLALGDATRILQWLPDTGKEYRAVIRLGWRSDTGDAWGALTPGADPSHLSVEDCDQALGAFRGSIQQVPPTTAAIKIRGVPAYRRVRRGEAVEMPSRTITVHRLDLMQWRPPDLVVDVTCSAGTYVRSIARDVGESLGCGGLLAFLVRTRSGSFPLADSHTLESVADLAAAGRLSRALRPLVEVLPCPRIPLTPAGGARAAHGAPVDERDGAGPWIPDQPLAWLESGDRLVALARWQDGAYRPAAVFTGEDP